MSNHKAKATEIHSANVIAGWWPENRNRAETLMLVVSEIAEAIEGVDDDLRDDKLTDEFMFDVELADTAIRLYDLCGIDAMDVDDNFTARTYLVRGELMGDVYHDLMRLVVYVSKAM